MIEGTAADLLWPTLCGGVFRCASLDGYMAVIVLDAPNAVADDEMMIAVRLHAHLGRGLLVVF